MKKYFLILILILTLIFFSSFTYGNVYTDSLIHQWTLNDTDTIGSTSIDYIGDYNLTINDAITGNSGILGEAYYFDGDNDYLNISNNFINFTEFTINYWIKPLDNGYIHPVHIDNKGGQNDFIIGAISRYKVAIGLENSASGDYWPDLNILNFNTWNNVVWIINEDDVDCVVNGVNISIVRRGDFQTQFSVQGANDGIYIGTRTDTASDLNGYIDNILFFDRALNLSEAEFLYNNGTGLQYPFTEESEVLTPDIDILFYNNSNIYKNNFGSGENFNILLNYTLSDGSYVNTSQANCNLTMNNGIVEYEGNYTNVELCDEPCDNKSIIDNLYIEDLNNAIYDEFYLGVCNNNLVNGEINVFIDCGVNNYYFNISSNDFGLCSNGFTNLRYNFSDCILENNIDINITFKGLPSESKIIEFYNIDRTYNPHINNNSYFNYYNNLWNLTHSHEYYNQGIYSINVSCINLENSDYNIDYSENIEIADVLPNIIFEQIIFEDNTIYNINESLIYQNISFKEGNYEFVTLIEDINIDTIQYIFYNNTGDIIYSNISNSNIPIIINNSLFADFDNLPINFTIIANDTDGNYSTSNILIYFFDNSTPTCSGLEDYNILINTNYDLNVNCQDEFLFSFDLECTNGYNYSEIGINKESFTLTDNFIVDQDIICNYEVCDGHTTNILEKDWNTEEKNNETLFKINNKINKLYSDDKIKIKLDKKINKYIFEIEYLNKDVDKTLYYQTSDQSYYIQNDKYLSWIIDYPSRTWFDLNNEKIKDFNVNYLGNGLYKINFKSSDSKIKFESIGELNCLTGSYSINLKEPNIFTELDTNSSSNVLLIGIFVFMWLVLFLFRLMFPNIITKSLAFFSGIFLGLLLYNIHSFLTLFMLLINILMMFYDRK